MSQLLNVLHMMNTGLKLVIGVLMVVLAAMLVLARAQKTFPFEEELVEEGPVQPPVELPSKEEVAEAMRELGERARSALQVKNLALALVLLMSVQLLLDVGLNLVKMLK